MSDTNISGSVANIGTNSYSTVYVGSNSSENSYNILSATSVVIVSTNLWIGYGGGVGAAANSNSLIISNGGIVSSVNGLIASDHATNNSVLVTGSGSLWTNSGMLSMGGGRSTNNSLTVSDGARLVSSNGQLDFETAAGGSSILIHGSGSLWSNTGNIDIGQAGVGSSVTISNEGQLLSASTTIGDSNRASGTVTVTDNSLLSNSGTMIIGNSGTGTVNVGSNATLAASHIMMGSNAESVATLNVGTTAGDSGNIIGNITFGNSTNNTVNFYAKNGSFTNQLIGGTNVTVNVSNSTGATFSLAESNSYVGQTKIANNSALAISNENALGNTNNALTNGSGSRLNLGGLTVTQATVFSDAGSRITNGALNVSSGLTLVGGANVGEQTIISASISGTGGVRNNKPGGGAHGYAVLTESNTYTGGTFVNGGNLAVSGSGTFGASTNVLSLSNTGTVNLNETTQTVGALTMNGGNLTNGNLNATTFTLTSGTNLISGTMSNTSGYTISGGANTIQGTNNNGNNVYDINGGNNLIRALLTGSKGLRATAGQTTLSTSNTYTGTNLVNGTGILITEIAGALGNSNNALSLSNTGTVNLNGTTQTVGALTMNGGNLTNGNLNASSITLAVGLNTINATVTNTGGSAYTIIGGTNTIQGTINNGANAYSFSGAGSSNNISAVLNGSGGLTNSGGAITLLSGASVYSGGTFISESTLMLSGGGTLGTNTGTTTLTNDSILDLGGTTQVQQQLIMGGCLTTNGVINNTEVVFTAGSNTNCASITGGSSVVSIGGTNTLSGTNNTYTGGTAITNSTLIVTANSSLGASTNTLSMSNATLNLSGGTNAEGDITINNATINNGTLKGNSLNITGGTNTITADLADVASGVLSITNVTGKTTLLGNNTYSGNLILIGGNLIAGSQTALGNSSINLDGSSSLTIINGNTTANSFYWASTHAQLELTSSNSFLQVQGLSMASSNDGVNIIHVDVLDNDDHIFLAYVRGTNVRAASFYIEGTRPGVDFFVTDGDMNIEGTNCLTLKYAIAATGPIIAFGNKVITNNFTTGNLEYAADSTLIISNNATLNVTNNYTSKNSGTLNYQFTGNSSDLAHITVDNSMFLAGKFIGDFVEKAPVAGTSYQIASARSITGEFITPHQGAVYVDGVLDPDLRIRTYYVGDPILYGLVAPKSYALYAQNQNQINVANALNSFIPVLSGDENTVSFALDSLTASQYSAAFNAISPALYTSMSTIAISTAVNQYNAMVQRLAYVRVAGVGFSSMGFADSPIMDDNKKPDSSQKDILIPSVDNRWGFFTDGNGVFANVNIVNQLPGYSAESGGVIFGSDYKWNDTFSTGLYAGYEGMQTKQSGGNFISDNGSRFGTFATYQHGGLFANAIAGGASHSYQVNRGIVFTGFNRTASSAPTAGELDALLATGYDVKRGDFTFGPITSLQYTYFGLQPFTETGAQSLDLSVGNANATSLNYILGSHCLYDWKVEKNLSVTPQLSLGWQHEFLQNPYTLNSSFSNGSNFNYTTTTPQRDSLFSSLGFNVNFKKKYDASFNYTASSCNPTVMVQGFNVSLGMRF